VQELLAQDDIFAAQVAMKKKLQSFFADTSKMPLEMMFIERNMRIVQGNNQRLGSPVNRIKISALWASRSLAELEHLSMALRLRGWWGHFKFLTALLVIDISFWVTRAKQFVWRSEGGFEDVIQKQMAKAGKEHFGIDIQPGLFDG
jgi:aarF domain-containing kinase